MRGRSYHLARRQGDTQRSAPLGGSLSFGKQMHSTERTRLIERVLVIGKQLLSARARLSECSYHLARRYSALRARLSGSSDQLANRSAGVLLIWQTDMQQCRTGAPERVLVSFCKGKCSAPRLCFSLCFNHLATRYAALRGHT